MTDQDNKNEPTPPEAPAPGSDSDTTAAPEATPEAVETTEEKPEQNVTVEEVGPARKKITIEIPESRIKTAIDDNYGKLQTEATIPGFRVGRAPMRLVQKRFGTAVRDDVKGQLISESYTQALEDNELDVIGEPDVKDIENLELPESGDLSFEVEIEVSPDVTLPDFGKLQVKKYKTQVTDEQVDEEVDRLQERMGQMQAIEEGAVEAEDYVQASVRVLAGEDAGDDAKELANHPAAYILVHGEAHEFKGHVVGIVVNDMGKRLIGKQVGDVERISMTGPSGHEDERIRDQAITLVINLSSIQRVQKAALDEVQTAMGVENEDDLKDRIRQSLEQQAERQQVVDMHKQVSDQLLEEIELELPEGLTSRQTERTLARRKMELYYQGKTEQEVEDQVAEMRSGSEEEAKRELKLFFILDRVAKQFDVEVDEDEINGRVAMQAMQTGRRPEKIRQEMQESGELQNLYLQVREQKALDAIIEQAQVEELDQPADEADAEDKKPAKKKSSKKKTTKKKAAKPSE